MASPSPRSVPATGLPSGVETGPLGKRFLASLVDALPLAVVGGAVAAVGMNAARSLSPTAILLGALVLLVWGLLVWWMYATRAAGPGMRLTRLQLVGLSDGRPIGWGRFLVRALVLAALRVTGVGLILMIVFLVPQRRRQGWHDLVANSVVIKQRPLAPPRNRRPATAATASPALARTAPTEEPSQPETSRSEHLGHEDFSDESAGLELVADHVDAGTAEPATVDSAADPMDAGETPVPPAAWVVVLDDGRELSVGHLTLLGRNPEPRPGEEDAELVKVADTSRTVSKSHLALRPDGDRLSVTDLGSTNGSTVTDYAGASQPCRPGEPVSVTEGTIVSFGDHWLEVRRDGRR